MDEMGPGVDEGARDAKIETGRECVVVPIGNWHLMLFHAPLTTGYEEFCIGNP